MRLHAEHYLLEGLMFYLIVFVCKFVNVIPGFWKTNSTIKSSSVTMHIAGGCHHKLRNKYFSICGDTQEIYLQIGSITVFYS